MKKILLGLLCLGSLGSGAMNKALTLQEAALELRKYSKQKEQKQQVCMLKSPFSEDPQDAQNKEIKTYEVNTDQEILTSEEDQKIDELNTKIQSFYEKDKLSFASFVKKLHERAQELEINNRIDDHKYYMSIVNTLHAIMDYEDFRTASDTALSCEDLLNSPID